MGSSSCKCNELATFVRCVKQGRQIWCRRANVDDIVLCDRRAGVLMTCGGRARLLVGKQNDSTTLLNNNSMYWWPSFQRRRLKSVGKLSKSMLSKNCSEMLIFGTYWKTWCSMVSEQTCTIDNKTDQSLRQTIISFNILHSSYMWIGTVLSCGKHCQTMQTGTVSGLRFCWRSWGFKIYLWRNMVRCGKSYVCPNPLDVKKSNFSFAQFNKIRNHFFGAGLRLGGITALDFWDLIVAVLGNTNQSKKERRDLCTNQREIRPISHTFQKRNKFDGMMDDLDNVNLISSKTSILLVRKLCCMYLKTKKQWSWWSWKQEVRQ